MWAAILAVAAASLAISGILGLNTLVEYFRYTQRGM